MYACMFVLHAWYVCMHKFNVRVHARMSLWQRNVMCTDAMQCHVTTCHVCMCVLGVPYAYMCVCMSVCMHACMHACMHVCMHVYK